MNVEYMIINRKYIIDEIAIDEIVVVIENNRTDMKRRESERETKIDREMEEYREIR